MCTLRSEATYPPSPASTQYSQPVYSGSVYTHYVAGILKYHTIFINSSIDIYFPLRWSLPPFWAFNLITGEWFFVMSGKLVTTLHRWSMHTHLLHMVIYNLPHQPSKTRVFQSWWMADESRVHKHPLEMCSVLHQHQTPHYMYIIIH